MAIIGWVSYKIFCQKPYLSFEGRSSPYPPVLARVLLCSWSAAVAGMPEESAASLRKLRALLTSGPRLPAWSAQLAGPDQLQETVRDLTRTFLVWVLHCHPVQSVKVVHWAGVRRGAGPPPGRRPHRAGEGRAGGSRAYGEAVSSCALKNFFYRLPSCAGWPS